MTKKKNTSQLKIKYAVPGNATKQADAARIGLISGFFVKKRGKGCQKTAPNRIPWDILHCATAPKEAANKGNQAAKATKAVQEDTPIDLTAAGHAAAQAISVSTSVSSPLVMTASAENNNASLICLLKIFLSSSNKRNQHPCNCCMGSSTSSSKHKFSELNREDEDSQVVTTKTPPPKKKCRLYKKWDQEPYKTILERAVNAKRRGSNAQDAAGDIFIPRITLSDAVKKVQAIEAAENGGKGDCSAEDGKKNSRSSLTTQEDHDFMQKKFAFVMPTKMEWAGGK